MKTVIVIALAFGVVHFSRAQVLKPDVKKDSAAIAACLLQLSNETPVRIPISPLKQHLYKQPEKVSIYYEARSANYFAYPPRYHAGMVPNINSYSRWHNRFNYPDYKY